MPSITEKKLDAYLALSLMERDRGVSNPDNRLPLDFSALSAFDESIAKKMTQRAAGLNELSQERRDRWLALWQERLRRKGETNRLDPQVHPEHVSAVLADEPQSIRLIIEGNIPPEMAAKVAVLLKSTSLHSFTNKKRSERKVPRVDDRILEIVRKQLLKQFVAFEDLFEEEKYDYCTTIQLGNVLWNLGLREIAIVCRGLKRMENIAAFLKRFEDESAKNIGTLISKLEKVDAERISLAEERVKSAFENEDSSSARIRNVGMQIFAEVLSKRSEDAIGYNLQKLPVAIAQNLESLISEFKGDESGSEVLNKEVIEVAERVIQGGAV